ncbi:hypothetical protein UK12_34440 [Saccharothrix sp. ST-888]|nr:hypothetical protein UK12_34440 [Saccharothrix sp. ST-888]
MVTSQLLAPDIQQGLDRRALGGVIGDGTSAVSSIRSVRCLRAGSGTGAGDVRALLYGCIGSRYSDSRSAISTLLPR